MNTKGQGENMRKIMYILITTATVISCSSLTSDPYADNIKKYEGTTHVHSDGSVHTHTHGGENHTHKVIATPINANVEVGSKTIPFASGENKPLVFKKTMPVAEATTKPTVLPKVTTTVVKPATNISKNMTFDEDANTIITYLADNLTENDEQIKKITISSIEKIREKTGKTLTTTQFLALAYKAVESTKTKSYYIAASRVINSQ